MASGVLQSLTQIVSPRPTALIPVANGSEEIETLAVANVLACGGVRVTIADIDGDEDHLVVLMHGLELVADRSITSCLNENYDVIVVPGGRGAQTLSDCKLLVDLLKRQKETGNWFAAIGSGAFKVLYHHAIVSGSITCSPNDAKKVGDLFRDREVVVSEHCVTSQGPSTAIAMALQLVKLLRTENMARGVAADLVVAPPRSYAVGAVGATVGHSLIVKTSTMSSNILLEIAHEQSAAFQADEIKSQWDYFAYSVKLVLARWTALRMAMEGQWGGGDMRRKYEILLDEILNVYKFNKVVHADAMAQNISEYVESEFGLICEDGSADEIGELMATLADECKAGQYDRVRALHEQVQNLIPIDLKKAKVRRDAEEAAAAAMEANGSMPMETVAEESQADLVDEDGFTTVRRSSRRKAAPKIYNPSVEFPGAN